MTWKAPLVSLPGQGAEQLVVMADARWETIHEPWGSWAHVGTLWGNV